MRKMTTTRETLTASVESTVREVESLTTATVDEWIDDALDTWARADIRPDLGTDIDEVWVLTETGGPDVRVTVSLNSGRVEVTGSWGTDTVVRATYDAAALAAWALDYAERLEGSD